MDDIMFGIRYRQRRYPKVFDLDGQIVLDAGFHTLLKRLWTDDMEPDMQLMEYTLGARPGAHGEHWLRAKHIYFPVCCSNGHWILLVVDVVGLTIRVYDSFVQTLFDYQLGNIMEPYVKMIPKMLHRSLSGLDQNLDVYLRDFSFERVAGVPQVK